MKHFFLTTVFITFTLLNVLAQKTLFIINLLKLLKHFQAFQQQEQIWEAAMIQNFH